MRIYESAVAGGTQFNGTTNGLISFADLAVPSPPTGSLESGNQVVVIEHIALELADATQEFAFDCRLMPVNEALASTRRITIMRDTAAGFAVVACRIPVPSEGTVGQVGPWRLVLTSTGKNVDARLIVVAGTGPWDGGGC